MGMVCSSKKHRKKHKARGKAKNPYKKEKLKDGYYPRPDRHVAPHKKKSEEDKNGRTEDKFDYVLDIGFHF